MELGIQVSSLKPLLLTAKHFDTACARMRALGITALQLQWIDPSVPIPAIAESLQKHGLENTGVQDFCGLVTGNLPYYMELNAATGGRYLTVSRIPDRCKSREGLELFARELRTLQDQLAPLGQILTFHPVSADFAAVPGFDAVGYLLEALPELPLCLDLYHLNRNCSDMPAYIRKYAGRIPMVHFKDAIGDTLVPAGSGDTNWEGVIPACLESGVAYAFAEQERWPGDPYEALGQALTWLASQR